MAKAETQKGVLRLRKSGGEVVVEGEPPEVHEFSARWIAAAVADGLVEVTVTLRTANGPHRYTLTGFAPDNMTTWAVALEKES